MINIPSFENFLNESSSFALSESFSSYTSYKDGERISDIIKKANGSAAKELQLAQTMANAIKGYEKAIARADAATSMKRFELAQIFLDKAKALPKTDNGYPINSIQYEIDKYMSDKRNRENYEAHLKGAEGKPDTNPDGVFFNVGIPTLHKQKDAEAIKLFKYALTRIVQNLAGQKHVWVSSSSYDEAKQILIVRVGPNFTYPKGQVTAAYKEYPKLLADYLNQGFGGDAVTAKKGEIFIKKDINYKRLIAAIVLTDIKTGNLKLPE